MHRFVVKDTIEERMLSAIEGSDRDDWNKENLTVGRLVSLFTNDAHIEDKVSSSSPILEISNVCETSDSNVTLTAINEN